MSTPTSTQAAPTFPKRADARRNYERILTVARKAFAEEIRMGAFEMDMLASSSMAQQIKAGAGWAIMFYMKNRMRWADRESSELTGKDGGPVDHDIRVEFVRAPKRRG